MKLLSFARSAGAAFALVLLGAIAQANLAPMWQGTSPSTTGPWTGDTVINISSLWTAVTNMAGINYTPAISASQTLGQATCTQLNRGMSQISTSAATGGVCLPTAIAGTDVLIANTTGSTVNLYGSAATAVQGTQDTINGVVGTTAYAGLTTGRNADCFAPATGTWYCSSGI